VLNELDAVAAVPHAVSVVLAAVPAVQVPGAAKAKSRGVGVQTARSALPMKAALLNSPELRVLKFAMQER
jgi:hypothetical protein